MSGETCNHPIRYKVYFAMETGTAPEAHGTFDETGVMAGNAAATGPRAGGYVTFGASIRTVQSRWRISFVSVANAEANLRREIGTRDLNVSGGMRERLGTMRWAGCACRVALTKTARCSTRPFIMRCFIHLSSVT